VLPREPSSWSTPRGSEVCFQRPGNGGPARMRRPRYRPSERRARNAGRRFEDFGVFAALRASLDDAPRGCIEPGEFAATKAAGKTPPAPTARYLRPTASERFARPVRGLYRSVLELLGQPTQGIESARPTAAEMQLGSSGPNDFAPRRIALAPIRSDRRWQHSPKRTLR